MARFFLRSALSSLGIALFSVFAASALAAGTLVASPTEGGPNTDQQGVPVDARVDRALLGNGGTGTGNTAMLSGATLTVGPTGTVRLQANTGNTQGGAPAGGNLCTSVALDWNRDIICNHASLQSETWYTFTLTGSLSTNSPAIETLAARTVYTFRTGGFEGGHNFLPPPIVTGGVPRPGSVIPTNARLRIYFNAGGTGGTTMQTSGSNSVLEPDNIQLMRVVDGEPQEANLLSCVTPGTACNMVWDQTGSQLIITPGKNASTYSGTVGTAITAGQKYLLMVNDGGPGSDQGPQNTAGMRLMGMNGPPFFAIFTATGADAVGPAVQATYPANAATGVDRALYDISIGFTEALDPLTVSGGTVALYQDNGDTSFDADTDTLITTTYVSYTAQDNTAHLSPSALLAASTKFFVVVRTGIKDIANNNLASQTVKSFTTGTNVNGGGSDAAGPSIRSINADNFSLAVTFSEPMKFDASVNRTKPSSTNASMVNNARNWKLKMLPEGFTFDLTASGRTIQYDPPTRTVVFGGLMMPPSQAFAIQAKTSSGVTRVQDLSANLLSPYSGTGTTRSMNDTQGMSDSGDFNFFTNGLRPKMVLPMSPIAGTTTNYEIMLATSAAIPSGGKLVFTFPTGFSTSANCGTKATLPMNDDINGPGAGTITIASIACDNVERTVRVTTGGAATQASDMLHFLIQAIVNTPVPSSSGTDGYRIDIQTQTSTGTLLESMTSMP
ncbi:MAG: Ig-like domain-containing protein, partial [Patescibacteria group bacterium]